MTEGDGRGPMPFLALLLAGVIVAVVVMGFFMYNGSSHNTANAPSHLSLNVKTLPHHR
jgi:hypothetical protein